MCFHIPVRFQHCGLALLKAQGHLCQVYFWTQHCEDSRHENHDATATLCPRLCSSSECERYRLMNEKDIIVHLLRSQAPAALHPCIKTSWPPFPANSYLHSQTSAFTKIHIFSRSPYLPLQSKSSFKQRLCACGFHQKMHQGR